MKNLTPFYFLICFLFFSNQIKSSEKNLSSNKVSDLMMQTKHLSFEENKGQFIDIYGNLTPYVLYKAQIPGLNIWVTTTGLTYQFLKGKEVRKEEDEKEEEIEFEWNRVDMIFKNANIKKENCVVEQNNEIKLGSFNYYTGASPNGIFDVKIFSKITIKNIYEGIDWVLYTNSNNSLKQDFVVHPNVNPNQIKLIYEGNGKFEVKDNQIYFENSIGKLQEGKLYTYQEVETNEITSSYIVQKNDVTTNLGAGNFLKQNIPPFQGGQGDLFSNEISIQVGDYDKSKALIIDPQLVWATFYGGATSFDGANAISTDSQGNIFITGYLGSTDFPTLNPGGGAFFQATHGAGNFDIFIMKFNNNGVHIWTTYYGGFDQDVAYSLCVDNLDNVIVTGYSRSSNFPLLNPGGTTFYQGTRADWDVIILKFDNNGVRQWATFYGGTLKEVGNSICTDANNNIYITGFTASTNFPILNQAGSYNQAVYGGGNFDGFVLKFNNIGTRLWATYFGGSGDDVGHGIYTDTNNNVLVAGETKSTNFPTINPGGGAYFVNTNSGGNDAFVSKFDTNANLFWSTYLGGTLDDIAYDVKTDRLGNIFVAGNTLSTNFPVLNPGGGAYYKGTISGTNTDDVFITKFTTNGNQLWSTYYGGTSDESFFPLSTLVHLAIDNCDNILVGFTTLSSNITTKTSCAVGYNDNTGSDMDAFVTQFTNNGVHLWASYIGAQGSDFRVPMAFDSKNNLFITGEWATWPNTINAATYPTTNPGGGAYFDNTHNGDDDVYILKFSPPTINANASVTPSGCPCSGTGTASATGGCSPYQYLWYDAAWNLVGNTQNVSNLCAGNYQVVVRDSMSCTIGDTVNVTVAGPSTPVITMGPTTNLSCVANSTGIIYANSTPTGNNYSWSGPGVVSGGSTDSATVNAPGTYTVTVTDPNTGCTKTGTVTVTNNNNVPDVTPGGSITITCINANGTIYASSTVAGATFSWSGPNIVSGANNDTATIGAPGTYTVIVTNPSNGCTKTDSVIVNSSAIIPTVTGFPDTLTCSKTIGNLNATSSATGGTYSWSGPGIVSGGTTSTPVINSTGTYTVIVTDPSNGCTNTTTVNVIADTISPNVTPGATITLTCTQTSGTISASSTTSGAIYTWAGPGIVSGGNTSTPSISALGTYTVTVTDPKNGCTKTATVQVNSSTPLPNVTSSSIVIPCNVATGVLNAASTTSGVTYNWSGPGVLSGGSTNSVTINAIGTYTVVVTDPATGCTNSTTVIVTSGPPPVATVSPSITIALGNSATLTSGGGVTYSWYPTTNLTPTTGNSVIANPTQTTTYCVEVADANGCKDTACTTVYVEIPCPTNENLQVPNAFSPNKDGLNDEFCLQGWTSCLEEFQVTIFDRWGEKVFESKDPNFCWDGSFRNTLMDAQVFVFYIKAKFTNIDKPLVKRGNISLIR